MKRRASTVLGSNSSISGHTWNTKQVKEVASLAAHNPNKHRKRRHKLHAQTHMHRRTDAQAQTRVPLSLVSTCVALHESCATCCATNFFSCRTRWNLLFSVPMLVPLEIGFRSSPGIPSTIRRRFRKVTLSALAPGPLKFQPPSPSIASYEKANCAVEFFFNSYDWKADEGKPRSHP